MFLSSVCLTVALCVMVAEERELEYYSFLARSAWKSRQLCRLKRKSITQEQPISPLFRGNEKNQLTGK